MRIIHHAQASTRYLTLATLLLLLGAWLALSPAVFADHIPNPGSVTIAGSFQHGANIPFTVPASDATVTFTYDSNTPILDVSVTGGTVGHNHDNNVEYFGLGHNSQDSLYRVPFGAVNPGSEIILRFRTYHNDVTGVRARFWNSATSSQFFQDMSLVASDVSCYDPARLDERCDFWQTSYTPTQIGTLYYRFIVTDGTAIAYYDDDSFQDGGWGEATPNLQDDSYVVTVYDPAFQPIPWMRDAVVYQVFPDRFCDGRHDNEAAPTEPRYGYPDDPLDQIINKTWDDLPEGHCRYYENIAPSCSEQPRGRDYFGGDLRGLQQRLNYLEDLGVTVIYLNPIFEAASNHAYDTQDYYNIDHFFGSNAEFDELIKQAHRRGIRIVLDGVFNHVSSDSPYFDRYSHFDTLGACESLDSPYRDWFFFREVTPGSGPCAGDGGPNAATYEAWFGFESLPVLDKANPEVRDLVYAADDAVARHWLNQGADGWRLDVMGDPSFPADFWPAFRTAVQDTKPDAPIIGELWKKHEVLPKIHGDQADTTMNYRFRNAILGFFGTVDNKGFVDDRQSNQPPSLFAHKLMSVREDYPDAAYYTLLNIMDSHDTQRILWSLTPGANNRQDKEFNADNLARGKQLLRLATVVQMTVPGAPTIYYGDEVGLTGDDDPDDRRPFPWDDVGPYGIGGDPTLFEHYRTLIGLRQQHQVFRTGEMTFLLTDDENRTFAYLLRSDGEAALVAINRHPDSEQTMPLYTAGRLPDDIHLHDALGTLPELAATDGVLTITLPPLSAAILLPTPGQDLLAPMAPTNLSVVEGNGENSLSWSSVADAARYKIYRSPVTGGGYVAVAETGDTSYSDTGLVNGKPYYYVVSALDAAGNEGKLSNEVSALPHFTIGWANIQWPPTLNHTISAVNRTNNVYGQVWIDGVTNQPGPTENLRAQLGFGPEGSDPADNPEWTWVEASFNVDAGNNDELMASMLPEAIGTYDYAYRYTTTNGRDWVYADLDGTGSGYDPVQAGKLTVASSGDTTPPTIPTGLSDVSASAAGIELTWGAVPDDPTLYGYEVRRSDASGGPYTTLALVAGATSYTDADVTEGTTYYYVVRAVDLSFNRSADSAEISAVAAQRTVTVTFNVTVPATTPGDESVYVAGTLDRLDGNLPQWNPCGVVLTRVDSTSWTITLTGQESTQIEYKYTLGSWDFVEKGASCEELNNRPLTLVYGSTGQQIVNDTVQNWRNISPCGN
jgi:glycosidase/fibronectin type 3 domain-containing protein